ncbi:conserved hypothetical protein [Candidatus Sulfopaludibacter sp. SbA4]|nr:conserved hypothetical protein [Candidatus Sulfopaludibacter sp. SbA4]
MLMEAALWIPVMTLLIVGMIQVGKITYLYYSLKKAVYTAARYLSVQQGVNFCDLADDPNVAAAFQLAVTGTADGSGAPLIGNFTIDMLQATAECVDAVSGVPGPCDTSACPTATARPDYILVNMATGFQVQPRIPFITLLPIQLRPSVMVPFGGTT